MSWSALFRRSPSAEPARSLYEAIVRQARLPDFYLRFEVPDTPDGRFDLILLHAVLVMRRLRREGAEAKALSQELFDLMFADMDQNLREMGVGDLAVGKRVKGMAKALYGRLVAYGQGIEQREPGPLRDALRRNLYRHVDPSAESVQAVADYLRQEAAALDRLCVAELMSGVVTFCRPQPATPGSVIR